MKISILLFQIILITWGKKTLPAHKNVVAYCHIGIWGEGIRRRGEWDFIMTISVFWCRFFCLAGIRIASRKIFCSMICTNCTFFCWNCPPGILLCFNNQLRSTQSQREILTMERILKADHKAIINCDDIIAGCWLAIIRDFGLR